MPVSAPPSAAAHRPYNFSAGPSALPEPVLRQAAAEMLDWRGEGLSVMEMSHRSDAFGRIHQAALARLRSLLAVPPEFHILFMQGGGLGHNALVPMNIGRGGLVDVLVAGAWSAKSLTEAGRYANAQAAADTGPAYTALPDRATWRLRDGAAYLHVCSNETIHGVEMAELPQVDRPLVVDASSHILSRPVDWSRVGLLFAGAQKNIGMAGLTIVIVRDDLLGHALPSCPSAFNYTNVAKANSLYNTPPAYAIYIAGLVFEWIAAQGGVAAMDKAAERKSAALYAAIDGSGGFYVNRVAPAARSRMNVPFFVHDDRLTAAFLTGAKAEGLLQLKGHASVGGLRASLYNALPEVAVPALVAHMQDFQSRHG